MKVEMKDSGIEWIGKIPHDWQVVRIKNTSLLKGRIGWQGLKSSEYLDEGAYLITGTDFQNGFISWEKCVRISKERFDEAPEIHIKENDLLITKDGTIGKVAVAINCPNEVSLNSGVLLIRNTKQIKYYSKYIFYVLMSDVFWNWYYSNQTGGSTIQHLYQEQFYNFTHILPPFQLQQQIANFLDEKCADIDQLITLQQHMIDELKAYKQSVITEAVCKGLDKSVPMKDSGIEWIGEVPEGWEIKKMNNICSIITDFVASGSFENLRNNVKYLDEPDYAMLVRTTDLSNKDRNISRVYISEHAYNFLSNSNLNGGEIILPNIGGVGEVYIVSKLYDKMSLAPNSIMFKTTLNDKYYYYYFLSDAGSVSIKSMSQSTAQPKFNKTQLRGLRVLVPPIEVQNIIAFYLDNKCAKIETLISIKQQKIDELKEYKKSMIYEYITGKKQVEL